MAGDVRYCTAPDGVRVAWSCAGSGPPLLRMGQPGWSNAETEPRDYRVGPLLSSFRVAWFDMRGTGYSERQVKAFPIDVLTGDIDAVAGAAGFEQFAILGQYDGGYLAVEYARRHPDRVTHLVLVDSWVEFSDWQNHPVERLWNALGRDWLLFTDAMVRTGGSHEGLAAERAIAAVRANISSQVFFDYWRATHSWDIGPVLAAITTPTLVLHYDGTDEPGRAASLRLASGIPNARLASYDAAQARVGLRDLVAGFVVGEHAEAPARPSAAASLTPREHEVLRLIAGGRSNRQIADDLGISERTVVRHIANIYAKIDAHGRADATAYAFRHHLV